MPDHQTSGLCHNCRTVNTCLDLGCGQKSMAQAMTDHQTERGPDRRKGAATFASPIADRRRPQFERRGTVPGKPPPTLEQQLYGERRKRPE